MARRILTVVGENVVDAIGQLKLESPGIEKLTSENLILRKNTAFRIRNLSGENYYGLPPSRALHLDEKYSLVDWVGPLNMEKARHWTADHVVRNLIDIRITGQRGGGGAYNVIFGVARFFQHGGVDALGSLRGTPPALRLVVTRTSAIAQALLPTGVEYCPLTKEEAGFNVVVSISGKKLVLRPPASPNKAKGVAPEEKLRDAIADSDVVVVDSLKDRLLLDVLLDALTDHPRETQYILAATDSMINAVPELTYKLATLADIVVANSEELVTLTGAKTWLAAAFALQRHQVEIGQVWVTLGPQGAAVLNKTGSLSFQRPTLSSHLVKDTTGAGDAFASMLAVGTVAGLDADHILMMANVAGQLATMGYGANGDFLATAEKILEFAIRHGLRPVRQIPTAALRYSQTALD